MASHLGHTISAECNDKTDIINRRDILWADQQRFVLFW